MYEKYQRFDSLNTKSLIDSYGMVAKIEKDGSKKRTYTIKSFPHGKFSVKVRAYITENDGTTVYGDFSKVKKFTIKEAAAGYKKSYDFSKLKKGDTFLFGSYEQDGDLTNGKEPIEWIVFSKDNSELYAVSRYALDNLEYHYKTREEVTWETCSLREWLNDKFYNAAFNKTEKKLIKTTTVKNYDNPIHGTSGGNDTKDKIFLLSHTEMTDKKNGFNEDYNEYDINRRCGATDYAVNYRKLRRSDDPNSWNYKTADGDYACDWWLRTPAYNHSYASFVYSFGYLSLMGFSTTNTNGIRPAMKIKLK